MKKTPGYLRKRRGKATVPFDGSDASYAPLLGGWLIDIALCLGWARRRGRYGVSDLLADNDFRAVTGLVGYDASGDEDADPDDSMQVPVDSATVEKILRARRAEIARMPLDPELPLFVNIETLGRLMALSDAEKAVLTFAVALSMFCRFSAAIGARFEETSNEHLARLLAAITGNPRSDVVAALSPAAPLMASGMLSLGSRVCDLEQKFDLLTGLPERLLRAASSEDDFIERFVKRPPPATLELADYPHLADDIRLLPAYLTRAAALDEQGANLMFYGPPGTGKTELAGALAAAVGLELYEVPVIDEQGDPVTGRARLRAYALCQQLLARKRNTLLLFDEVEEVLGDSSSLSFLGMGGDFASKTGKGWVARTLESGGTPAIWITNDADVDPAYLRRFDYSVRFPVPPRCVRLSVARHHFKCFNPPDDWLQRIVADGRTSPGQYEKAARVARIVGTDDGDRALQIAEQVLQRSDRLLGHYRRPADVASPISYDPGVLNIDVDPSRLIGGLRRRPRAALCFYGVPGSGKSAFARHIADAIGKPCLVRRTSDILSMWVGGTERNIAAMFVDANDQDAVLVLDEADSLLADRVDAQQSWEVARTNELLTQMEAFDGLFICTTNLVGRLDRASLRRFTFKVEFGYLSGVQAWRMFRRELVERGVVVESKWRKRVVQMDSLTPGDFATVARQFNVCDDNIDAALLYERLQRECEARGVRCRPIGFCPS